MTGAQEIFVLDKKVRLLQPEKGFRTSLDSVMAAAACPVKTGERLLDMGCGIGTISFCVLHRVPKALITGIDIQEKYIVLAKENIALNAKQASFLCHDIRTYQSETRFDHIVCNPPFLESGHHIPSPEESLAVARGHQYAPSRPPASGGEGSARAETGEEITLKDWIDAGFRTLKSGGSLTIIHRADAIGRIINGLGKRFGAIEIIPLWPHANKEAKRVIVRARKDRKSPAHILPGLILHQQDGNYTEEADKILRAGQSLFL